jgi:NADPH:quinone reductase-like Zn-dependent oxidoreductase
MTTMMAVRLHSYGGPEVLALEEVPRAQAGAGEVPIRVRAAGVNPRHRSSAGRGSEGS